MRRRDLQERRSQFTRPHRQQGPQPTIFPPPAWPPASSGAPPPHAASEGLSQSGSRGLERTTWRYLRLSRRRQCARSGPSLRNRSAKPRQLPAAAAAAAPPPPQRLLARPKPLLPGLPWPAPPRPRGTASYGPCALTRGTGGDYSRRRAPPLLSAAETASPATAGSAVDCIRKDRDEEERNELFGVICVRLIYSNTYINVENV